MMPFYLPERYSACFCLQLTTSFLYHKSSDRLSSSQAGSHIQTLMGSQSLQHRSREQQPYEGNINKVTIQQFQSPLPIQIPSSQATRGPQPGRCLIQTKGQRSMDGYPEQVRRLFTTKDFFRKCLGKSHHSYNIQELMVSKTSISHKEKSKKSNSFSGLSETFFYPLLTPTQLYSTAFECYKELQWIR